MVSCRCFIPGVSSTPTRRPIYCDAVNGTVLGATCAGGYTTSSVRSSTGDPIAKPSRFDLSHPQNHTTTCVALGGHRFKAYNQDAAELPDAEYMTQLREGHTDIDTAPRAAQSLNAFHRMLRDCRRVTRMRDLTGMHAVTGLRPAPDFVSAFCTGITAVRPALEQRCGAAAACAVRAGVT